MPNMYPVTGGNLTVPAHKVSAVTPSNTVDFAYIARGLYIGVAGDVTLVDITGGAITFTAVPAGTLLPVLCSRVNSTGTTATNMVALF